MREQVMMHLEERLKAYRNKGYGLAYVLHALRREISAWLREQGYKQDDLSYEQQTLMALEAMCLAGMHVD